MAGCNLTKSLLVDCTQSYVGGVKELYVTEFDSVLSVTKSDASGVTAITMDDGKQFYRYQFVKNSASFTDAYTANDTGSGAYVPTITVNIKGLRQDVKIELEALARIESIAIIKDANGKFLLVGLQNGLTVSTVTGQTGANSGELNGYQALTLTGAEPTFSYFVNPSLIPDLLVPAS